MTKQINIRLCKSTPNRNAIFFNVIPPAHIFHKIYNYGAVQFIFKLRKCKKSAKQEPSLKARMSVPHVNFICKRNY